MDDNGHKIVGDIDDQNMVTKVDSWLPNPVLGDMLVETTFTDYKDFGGVKFPAHIVQKQGGLPVLDLTVTARRPMCRRVYSGCRQRRSGEEAAAGERGLAEDGRRRVVHRRRDAQQRADRVQGLRRGGRSAAERRAFAGRDGQVKKLVPNKPIKYVFNTHHHFDHSGGLRTYVAEGATIITQEGNKSFYETAWNAPRTLQPDSCRRIPRRRHSSPSRTSTC